MKIGDKVKFKKDVFPETYKEWNGKEATFVKWEWNKCYFKCNEIDNEMVLDVRSIDSMIEKEYQPKHAKEKLNEDIQKVSRNIEESAKKIREMGKTTSEIPYQPKHAKEENVVASLFYAQHNMGKDGVQHPSHYNNGGMECWDEMELIFGTEATMWFCLLSAWKYRYRMNDKDTPEKNMRKSHECIKKYKELKEKLEND